MRSPDALFGVRRQSIGLNGTNAGLSSNPHMPVTGALSPASASDDVALHSQSLTAHHPSTATPVPVDDTQALFPPSTDAQSVPPLAAQPSMAKEPCNWPSNSVGGSNHWDSDLSTGAALHPAIRAHYAAMLQNRNVKVETHPDTGGTAQPLAMIPPLPTTPSAHSNSVAAPAPATPAPGPPPTTPFGQFASGQARQPKSTTPIPPPSVPASSSTPQRTATPVSSVKTAPAVPRQTHIPAPRPWEALRKMQTAPAPPTSTQPSTPFSTISTPGSALMTPSPQALPGYGQPEGARHFPQPGFYPNHVVSGPFRHTLPPIVPNSNRFSLPAFGPPPYGSPHQPPHHLHNPPHPPQYIYHYRRTQQVHDPPPQFPASGPHLYRFPQ